MVGQTHRVTICARRVCRWQFLCKVRHSYHCSRSNQQGHNSSSKSMLRTTSLQQQNLGQRFHPLYPMIQPNFYIEELIQNTTSRARMGWVSWRCFDVYRQYQEELWAETLRRYKVYLLYFSPWVVFYKASPCDRYYVFIDRIFHPRHEHWLHSLIARILLHQLPVPNVLDTPEAFFVKYQQKKIMKSNRILQKRC